MLRWYRDGVNEGTARMRCWTERATGTEDDGSSDGSESWGATVEDVDRYDNTAPTTQSHPAHHYDMQSKEGNFSSFAR